MRTIHGIFGRPSHQPFAFFDPDSWSVRTSQATFLSDSTRCSVTLPKWGTCVGGALYELPTPGRLTSGQGCSGLLPTPITTDQKNPGAPQNPQLREIRTLLPTAQAQDGKGGRLDMGAWGPGGNGKRPSGAHATFTLATAVALLPTPAVNDMGAGKTPEQWDSWTDDMRARHGNGNGHGRSLAIETQRLLPTPSASDSTGGSSEDKRDGAPGLRAVGHLLPTPTAMDSQASGGSSPRNVTLTDAVVRTEMGTTPNPRLLPTPMSAMYEQGGDGGELRAAIQHGPTRRLPGASTSLPSEGGNTPPEPPPHGQLTIEDA